MKWKYKKELCFVVQRYGPEIVGGAEALCRAYVNRLKDQYNITVLTTCAKDYNTWKNEYPSGYEEIDGVTVRRFYTAEERDQQNCARLTMQVYGDPYHDLELSSKWLRSIGPYCPGIPRFIRDHAEQFDLFLFVGYMYYQTTFGLPMAPHKAVLIPTAHEEDALLRCNYFHTLFNIPAGIIYLTQEERSLVQGKFLNKKVPSLVAGSGVDLPEPAALEEADTGEFKDPYIVYIGRIDDTKDCSLLFRSFIRYKEQVQGDLKLVLIGERFMDIPQREDIIPAGFVSEEKKYAILRRARALALPSLHESLSIVTLEAMALGVPVLLRGGCPVLKGHAERSGAGFCFDDEREFCGALKALLGDSEKAGQMGNNAKQYIQKYYKWDIIIDGIQKFIEQLTERTDI